MSDDVKYYNQTLWQGYDGQISTNNLVLDKMVVKNNWGISPPKLKITIQQYKNNSKHYITMSHQNVFTLIQKFQKVESEMGLIIKSISKSTEYQKTISAKFNSKNIIITFLNRIEYSEGCVRLIISDKNQDYLDSEKFYMTIYDFLSMMMIIAQFRKEYISIVDSINTIVKLEDLKTEIYNLSEKLTGYYSEFVNTRTHTVSSSNPSQTCQLESVPQTKSEEEYSPFDTIKPREENLPSSSSVGSLFDETPMNDDMNSYINKNLEDVDLGLDKERVVADTSTARLISDDFTKEFLKNDILNLEMYIINCVNDELPFSKFIELIKSKLAVFGYDPLEGIDQSEINSVNYLICNYLKYNIKMNLEEQIKLPPNIAPIVFNSMKRTDASMSLLIDLFLYSIFYSQLRNALQEKSHDSTYNKEFMCFSLKTIVAPLAFSMIRELDEELIVTEIINRFNRYKEDGVFDKLLKSISEKFSYEFNLSGDTIKNESTRIIQALKKSWDKITIERTFQKLNYLNLTYDDFKKNSLTEEQIKKLVAIEFNFRKNSFVNFLELSFKGIDDLPSSIMSKFGILQTKFDNTNLKRYIKEVVKEDEKIQKLCLDIADNINESYRDLKNVSVDLTPIPNDVLKAIFLWDLSSDIKISQNYIYYRDLVIKSTLTKDMIISLLSNIQDSVDMDFINAFIASRDE